MRVLGLSFVSCVLSTAFAQDEFDFTGCGKEGADEKCTQKIDSVVEVTPGISFFSTIACKDCPYAETWNENSDDGKPETRVTHGDQELVSLSSPRLGGGCSSQRALADGPVRTVLQHHTCQRHPFAPSQRQEDLSRPDHHPKSAA